MKIKIKNNKNEFLINVKVNADVKDLKRKIEAKCGIPTYRQKIIKKGKVLLDKNPLSFYEITPSDTLMLLGENPASGISKHLAHIKAIFSLEVDDIVTVIFSFLSIRDLQLCLRVSKTWRALAEQNTFAVDRYEILHSQVCFDLLIGKPIYLLESNSPVLIPYEVCSSSSTNNNNNSDSDAPTTMIEDDQQQQQQQENHDDNSDSDDSYDDVDSSSQMNKKKRVSSSSTAALVPPPFDCNLASVRASQYLFVHRRCDSTQLSSDVIECRELETGCLLWRKNVCSIISSIPELEQLVRLDELQDQFDQEREDLLLSYRRRRGGGGLRQGAGGADDMPPPSRFTVQLFCDWKLQRLFVKVYDICLAAFNIADADLIAAMKNIGSSCGTPVPSPKMVAYYCGSNRLDYAASKREWRLVSSWMVDNVVLASIAITGGTEQDRYTIVALNKTQLRPVTSSVVDTAYYFVRDNGNMFFHVHDADYDHEILDSTSRAVTTGHWRIRSVAQFTKHHVLIGGSEVINLNCGGGHTVWGGNRRQSGESAFMLYENPETGDLDGVFTLSSGSSGSSTVQVQLLALMKEYKYKWVGREKKVIEEVAEVPCWKTEVRLDDNDHGGARSKYRSFARAGNLLLAAFLSKCGGGSSKIIVCAIVVFGIHAGTVVWKTSVPLLLSVNKSPRCDGISIRERGKVVFVDSFEYISPATRKNSAVPEGCTCTAAVYAFKLSSGELLDKMLMCAPAGVVDPTSAAASISTEQ